MQDQKKHNFKIKLPPEYHAKTTKEGISTSDELRLAQRESLKEQPLKPNNYVRYGGFTRLGYGWAASVCSGLDINLHRQVAIKLLRPIFRGDKNMYSRFVREAQIMAILEHPNIVPVHEVGMRWDGLPYFTMKQLKGVTLQTIISELSAGNEDYLDKYTLAYLLRAFIQVCQAIAFAHSHSILHRDLKPSSIQLGDYGEAYVMEWGLAKKMEHIGFPLIKKDITEAENQHHEMFATEEDGHISGTPLYMSPEQAEGHNSSLDERTDVYSLGAILYEILTLKTAIPFDEIGDVFHSIRDGNITPPRKRTPGRMIPPELNSIAMKALATDPEQRYHSVLQVIHDLERFLEGRPISAYRAPFVLRCWTSCKRHVIIGSGIAASAAASLILILSFLFVGQLEQHVYLRAGENELVIAKEKQQNLIAKFKKLERLQSQRPSRVPSFTEISLQNELRRQGGDVLSHIDLGIHILSQAKHQHIDDSKCKLTELNRLRTELVSTQEKLLSNQEKEKR